jgi:copper(I)-binding protein
MENPMKNPMKCIPFVLTILAMSCATQALAESFKVGTIAVDQPWIRATPKGASSAAGYFRITNSGTTADRLTGGSSPIAGGVEIHEMSTTNGVMKMRPLPNGLEIKPGETVEVKPNSFHLMLVGLKQQVKQGDHVKGTLTFEQAGALEVEFTVESIGAQQPASTGMQKSPGMGNMKMGPGMQMH